MRKSSSSKLCVADTPPDKQKHKTVLKNPYSTRFVPDTPKPNAKQQVRKLFNPNQLDNDDLPGINDENNITTRKSDRRISVKNIFKPKNPQTANNSDNRSTDGCDDSFETLKRRENSRTRKVVRLSQVLSELEVNECTQSTYHVSQQVYKDKRQSVPMTTNNDDMSSLTNVTDFSETDHITICNGNTSLILTIQHYVNNNTEPFTNLICDEPNGQDETASMALGHVADSLLAKTIRSCDHSCIPDTNPDYSPRIHMPCVLNRNEATKRRQTLNDHSLDLVSSYHPMAETIDIGSDRRASVQCAPDSADSDSDASRSSLADTLDELSLNDDDRTQSRIVLETESESSRQIQVPMVLMSNNPHPDQNPNKYSKCKKVCITYTSLTRMQLKLLKKIAKQNFDKNTSIEKCLDARATHLVVGSCGHNAHAANKSLNAKILLALLNNCKLVKFEWVLKSSSEKYWLNESAFVTDEYRKHREKYRQIDDSSTRFKIFAKYDSLYICSNLNESERDYYYQMLLKFGGQLTSRPNRARLILCNTIDCKFNTDLNKIFKNRRRPPTISTDWILDCVLNLKHLDFNKYIVQQL